jgi:sterol desaturase/sphingolipid hydroxylase (fatty acid hydroxylase superfamily)
MCKKPEPQVEDLAATKEFDVVIKDARITPTHTAPPRDSSYDWLIFLLPAVFYKVTPIAPFYVITTLRLLLANVMLSLHYIFVDKDNYHQKLTQKQLHREKDEYMTAVYMHMWTQVPLQIIFPSLFFTTSMSELSTCLFEILLGHVLIVEPLYYTIHRWLHVPTQMKAMHGFHHLSISTLPTTALVQNAYEHVIYVCTFAPAFLVPFLIQGRQHWLAIGIYLFAVDLANGWGHTNIRLRHWIFHSLKSPLTYLFYSPEFHQGHHSYFQANYALFMPIWDIIFGTYREYRMKDVPMLPKTQQDFVFVGHVGMLGQLLTVPEVCFYNIYDDFKRTWLPTKHEFFVLHLVSIVFRVFNLFYYSARFCVANEHVARLIALTRTPYDYMQPKSYDGINREIVELIRLQYDKYGTRLFGLGNLNKMQQLNNSGKDIVRMVEEDPYLADKKIRIWTGDTMTVASVYHQIADIPKLASFFYIGAGGKVGRAVCELLVKNMPHIKIRIFSLNHFFDHPNITYSTDLSEMADYKVVLVGKILSRDWYNKALKDKVEVKTRYILDYTVPVIPIEAMQKRPENIQHVRVGLLKTSPNNPFLKGHYDIFMGHDENHIVPCHFGCLMNMINERETHEVGCIDVDAVEKLWKMALARGFRNVDIAYEY